MFVNYFDKIRNLNNLQLAHFLKNCHANLELVGLALISASDNTIYCSEDSHCTATYDKGKTDYYNATYYWFNCLNKELDEDFERDIKNFTDLIHKHIDKKMEEDI